MSIDLSLIIEYILSLPGILYPGRTSFINLRNHSLLIEWIDKPPSHIKCWIISVLFCSCLRNGWIIIVPVCFCYTSCKLCVVDLFSKYCFYNSKCVPSKWWSKFAFVLREYLLLLPHVLHLAMHWSFCNGFTGNSKYSS